jgi:steroid delta-isomerase-like uncharacterized protein
MLKFATCAAFAMIVGAGAASSAYADPALNKAIVLRPVTELWSPGDLQVVEAIYGPEFVCHNLVGPEWRGINGIKEAIKSHRAAFPDWHERVEDIVAEGDRVAIRFTASGTHRGTFAGMPATDRKVTVREVSFYRLSRGKIVEQWGMPDVFGMMTQLRTQRQTAPAHRVLSPSKRTLSLTEPSPRSRRSFMSSVCSSYGPRSGRISRVRWIAI